IGVIILFFIRKPWTSFSKKSKPSIENFYLSILLIFLIIFTISKYLLIFTYELVRVISDIIQMINIPLRNNILIIIHTIMTIIAVLIRFFILSILVHMWYYL